MAEESGLIIELGQDLLHQTCVMLRRNPGITVPFSVNVSPVELADEGWLGRVRSVLAETGISGSRLVMELTESAIFGSPEWTQPTLQAVRDLGCGLHLDDFGTGFSSIAHLRDVPLTGVKLDASFVRDLGDDAGPTRAIVLGLGALAASMGLEAIAEGVETEAQASILSECGWEIAQGYLFGRAEPIIGAPAPATAA